ncbi:DUF4232 domain-containing protein [Streptomyces sp. NBC_01537]|uniref:DUF4232 domain-containing protein n=1 Tax=Streptomyces sp. NBC_01537 TaxID=2903896 RepID=UPI00386FA65D
MDCTKDLLTVVVSKVSSPVNHLVIEAVNKGSRTCVLYEFPYMRFTADREEPVEPVEESNPNAVVTLAPGATAYAGVTTASTDGSGADSGHKATTFGLVMLTAEDGGDQTEVQIPLPGGSLYVEDDSARVTYWQVSRSDALTW